MGATSTSLPISKDQPTADVVLEAALHSLRLRGEPSDGVGLAGALGEALALVVFATLRDPSDAEAVSAVADAVRDRLVETMALLVAKVEGMVQ